MQRKSSLEVTSSVINIATEENTSLVTSVHQSVGCLQKQICFLFERICPVVVAVVLDNVVVLKVSI